MVQIDMLCCVSLLLFKNSEHDGEISLPACNVPIYEVLQDELHMCPCTLYELRHSVKHPHHYTILLVISKFFSAFFFLGFYFRHFYAFIIE